MEAEDRKLDRTLEDSFPASDPPANSGVVGPRAQSFEPDDNGDERIHVLEAALWPDVPSDVIKQAKLAAELDPSWIAMRGNDHFVAMAPPGSPDMATGDMIYVAEVSPVRRPDHSADRRPLPLRRP